MPFIKKCLSWEENDAILTSLLCCETQWLAGQPSRGRRETTSTQLLLPSTGVLASRFPSSVIKSSSYSLLGLLPFLSSFPRCCEVMSPCREDKNTLQCTCCSICRLTWAVCANLNRDGLAGEYLPLSNYKPASREGESTSTIPSRSLISHSFSYWIFLFKGTLLMLPTSSAAKQQGKLQKKTGSS